MKLSIKTFAILSIAATMMYACNSNDKTTSSAGGTDSSGNTDKSTVTDTSAHAADTSGGGMKTAALSPEQDFLNFAIPANAKEIIWLKAGIDKGSLKDIKEHSKMMLKDHEKLGATVKDFMSKHPNYTMPALDTANTVNINDKTGSGWDKAWTDKMVSDHGDLLEKLKTAHTDVKDSALAKIVTTTIPVVESHLAMVKTVQGKIK